jgi:hypothetical protein
VRSILFRSTIKLWRNALASAHFVSKGYPSLHRAPLSFILSNSEAEAKLIAYSARKKGSNMEYAVKGETHEGKISNLRRGFASEEEAGDHPIQMSLWKRVWVEPIDDEQP